MGVGTPLQAWICERVLQAFGSWKLKLAGALGVRRQPVGTGRGKHSLSSERGGLYPFLFVRPLLTSFTNEKLKLSSLYTC